MVQAEVLEEHGGRDSYIKVTFTTLAGKAVEGETSNYVEPVDPGDTIEVLYDPRDPMTFQARRWGTGLGSYGLTYFLMAVGLGFLWCLGVIVRRGTPGWLR